MINAAPPLYIHNLTSYSFSRQMTSDRTIVVPWLLMIPHVPLGGLQIKLGIIDK
jgi:hypothetical protein